MDNINKIKEKLKTDKKLPTVLKGISIEECNDSNMITTKVAYFNQEANSLFNLILAFNKPISKCF